MSKTLTALRKDLDLSTASDVKNLAKLFGRIAKSNPDAIKAVLSPYLRADKVDGLIELYADQAEYIVNLFNLD